MPSLLYSSDYPMKMHIAEAFMKCLKTSTFEQVTVKQICEEAEISRPTFYNHFRDKFDIPHWHFDLAGRSYLYEGGRSLPWRDSNYLQCCEMLTMRDLYVPAFKTEGFLSILEYGRRQREENVFETLRDFKHVTLDDELVFQVHALVLAEPGMSAKWGREGMTTPPATMASYLEGIVPPRLYALVRDATPRP